MNYSDKVAQLWADEATEGRIYWHDDLTSDLGIYIAMQLDRCERDRNIERVTLDINSVGGNGAAMWHIIDRIRSMKTPVITVCSGRAMSSGFMVLASGKTRKAYRHSTLMFHGAWHWLGLEKSPSVVNEADVAKAFDDMMCEYLGEVTKKRASHWQKIVSSQMDRYVTVEEALEWGVVDEIV